MKAYTPFAFANSPDKMAVKLRYADQLRRRGTERAPVAPRDIVAQAGSRSALITWKLPEDDGSITGWQLAVGTESNIVFESANEHQRQYTVPLTAGATPPKTLVFVRSVNASGVPSEWISATAQAAREAAGDPPPSVPTPPPGFTQEEAGGNTDSDNAPIGFGTKKGL